MSDRQKSTRKRPRQPNRAQRKAQEIRLAESSVPAPVDLTVALEKEELVPAPTTAPESAKGRGNRRQAQPVAYALPRDVEYAYISADLRRLIITATALLAFMFILLFFLD